jgi:hypothetical protein
MKINIITFAILLVATVSCDKTGSNSDSSKSGWRYGEPRQVGFSAHHLGTSQGPDDILTVTHFEVREVYGDFGVMRGSQKLTNDTNYVFTARGTYILRSSDSPRDARIVFGHDSGWGQAEKGKRKDMFDVPGNSLSGSFEVSLRLGEPMSYEFFNAKGFNVAFHPKKDDSRVTDVVSITAQKN